MKGQWGKLVGYFVGAMLVSAALAFVPPLIGGGSWLPDRISTEGRAIDDLFWGLMWLCVVIFAGVSTFVVYSIVHFRAAPGDLSDGEHIHGNAKMEVAWIVLPSLIVFVIGVISYMVLQDNEIGLFDKAAAKKKGAATMQVDVHAFSFGWNFRYADRDGKLVNEDAEPSANLVLPVGEVVRFNVLSCSGKEKLGRLREQVARELSAGEGQDEFAEIPPGICEREWDATTEDDQKQAEETARQVYEVKHKLQDGKKLSGDEQKLWDEQPAFRGDQQFTDVNHAFWVPEARLKIDAIYGLRTYVQWEASRVTGPDDHFEVVCAELCGTGHNGMRTEMCVVDGDTFDWWVALDTETQRTADCVTLRLFSCIDDKGDRDELLDTLAAVTKEHPDATCEKAQEAAA